MKRPGRPRRLPARDYIGEKVVCFDACIWDRERIFTARSIVEPQIGCLRRAASIFECVIPIYCFMPDHLHVMITGLYESSNCLAAMTKFKCLSGIQFSKLGLVGWQGNFFDHIVRGTRDWRAHARYIAMNPVRAELVENYQDYPFLGSIGCELEEVLSEGL